MDRCRRRRLWLCRRHSGHQRCRCRQRCAAAGEDGSPGRHLHLLGRRLSRRKRCRQGARVPRRHQRGIDRPGAAAGHGRGNGRPAPVHRATGRHQRRLARHAGAPGQLPLSRLRYLPVRRDRRRAGLRRIRRVPPRALAARRHQRIQGHRRQRPGPTENRGAHVHAGRAPAAQRRRRSGRSRSAGQRRRAQDRRASWRGSGLRRVRGEPGDAAPLLATAPGAAERHAGQHGRRPEDGPGAGRGTVAHVALPRQLRFSPQRPRVSFRDPLQEAARLGARDARNQGADVMDTPGRERQAVHERVPALRPRYRASIV